MILLAVIVGAVIAQRLGELLLARRNYRWAMAHGGREYGAGHYVLFVLLHSAWIGSIALEWLTRQPPLPPLWPLFAALIAAAQVLRYWTIRTMGRCWNTRIVVFAGMNRITGGPFRYLDHPNYLAVVIEIAAIPALLGAWYTAAVFSLLNSVLLLFVRLPIERRALRLHLAERGKQSSG